MLFHLDGVGSLSEQIYRNIKTLIETGVLSPDEQLPSSRSMTRELGVSRNTVLAALRELEAEGYVATRPRAGVFVATHGGEHPPPTPDADELRLLAASETPRLRKYADSRTFEVMYDQASRDYDFRYGRVAFPDASRKAWADEQRRALRRIRQVGSNAPVAGSIALRRAICGHLAKSRGIVAEPGNLIVTGGTQETIALTMGTLLEPGDEVIVERPGYAPVEWTARLWGADVSYSPVDERGLRPECLPGRSARIVVVTPSHQFPLGGVMPPDRRLALHRWAQDHRVYILEDDYDGELRYDTRPIAALKAADRGEVVVYAGSFSKTMHPNVRLGYAVVPDHLVAPFSRTKALLCGPRSDVDQEALANFVDAGLYQKHLNRVRKLYRARRQELLAGIKDLFGAQASVFGSSAGLHVAVSLKGVADRGDVRARLDRVGIGATVLPEGLPGAHEEAGVLWLALSYGGIAQADIAPGLSLLAETLGVG